MISIRFIMNVLFPIFLIFLFVLLIFVQFKLSKTKEFFWGLVIPIITFIILLTLITGYIIFNKIENLNILFAHAVYLTIAFCIISIIVHFVIYFHCKKNNKIDLDKINIQDLD